MTDTTIAEPAPARPGERLALPDIIATGQNTVALQPGETVAITGYLRAGQVFYCAFLNNGPGGLWARWDAAGDAAAGDPNCVYIPAGAGYTSALTRRMTFCADADPGGALVSFTCE